MLNFTIRPISIADAEAIREIRTMDGVRENMYGIFSERPVKSEEYIRGLTDNDHVLVAEIEENGSTKVVGMIGMKVNANLRLRHSASVGVMVHRQYQGKGIGTALFKRILDLADNWLMLVRLELTVVAQNSRAMELYKSLGFEIEGLRKYSVIKNGKYADEYLMARYRL